MTPPSNLPRHEAVRKLIIDCDPGQDDAIMLLLALACPDELQILGITTVAGNVPLALTQRNARLMCELAGRQDVPVFAGCEQPLERSLITAENVHGKTGIDGMPIHEPRVPLQQRHAVDFIVDTLKAAAPESVTLVPTGPLTNIAAAIRRDRSILKAVREIVWMGGAMREGGNTTPSAEFNACVDPEAVAEVLACGRPLTICGLDLTHQVLITHAWMEQLQALPGPVARHAAAMLDFFNRYDSEKYHTEGAPLHDPCTIAWLLAPQLFKGKRCNIEVEIHSPLTFGHTAVDFWAVSGRAANANWLYQVDADGFFELLLERLARYAH